MADFVPRDWVVPRVCCVTSIPFSRPHPPSPTQLNLSPYPVTITTSSPVLCLHHVLFTFLSTRRVPVSELSINRLEHLSTSPGGGTIRAVLNSLDFPAYKVRTLCYGFRWGTGSLLKGHSQLWDRADLDTSFLTSIKVHTTWNQSSSRNPLQFSQCFAWFSIVTCFWVSFCSSCNIIFIKYGEKQYL